jgi:hypothetical protein
VALCHVTQVDFLYVIAKRICMYIKLRFYILYKIELKFTDALPNSIGTRQCDVHISWDEVQRTVKAYPNTFYPKWCKNENHVI